MNIDALQSFLDVAETGSFSVAASRANLTQSTVSARIRALEDNIGAQLFRRSRNGAELTPAGHQFRPYADQIVEAWTQARIQISLPKGYDRLFRLGGPVAIGERLSLDWTLWMKQQVPNVALHLEAGTSASLCERLLSQSIDAGIMYLPQRRPGLVVEELLREEIVLVRHRDLVGDWIESYVNVDWGPEFSTAFRKSFPHARAPTISVSLGILGMQYIMALAGAGYLPLNFVRQELERGQLQLVEDAPHFHRPVYIVYPTQSRDATLLEVAITGLRHVASTLSVA